MSKIGENPILLPEEVEYKKKKGIVVINGPKGELELKLSSLVDVDLKDRTLNIKRKADSRKARSMHGTTRTLIANMIKGVTKGYSKSLELHGVGYRAQVKDEKLVMRLGFSHPVEVEPSRGIEFTVSDKKQIDIKGIDKQKVAQTAAEIRALRKPEPYKGKGIRYKGEVVKLKPGKAAKIGEGEI